MKANQMSPISTVVMVLSSPLGAGSNANALRFCQAWIDQGHVLPLVFFYGDGVYTANNLPETTQGECDLFMHWQQWLRTHHINAVACIASSLKRGLFDEQEQQRYQKQANNVAEGFRLGGLGDWVEASRQADKTMVFG